MIWGQGCGACTEYCFCFLVLTNLNLICCFFYQVFWQVGWFMIDGFGLTPGHGLHFSVSDSDCYKNSNNNFAA